MQSLTTPPIRRTNRGRDLRLFVMISVSLIAAVLVAFSLLRPISPVAAQERPGNDKMPRQVTVSGATQIQATPNTAYITIVDDLAQIGEVIDNAVASGANSVRSIRFEVAGTADLLDEAR